MIDINIENHLAWFNEYTAPYLLGDNIDVKALNLKFVHSLKVLENSLIIVKDNDFKSELSLPTILAALYHDVGRFPQYIKYKTFKDSISVNHALLGAKILKKNHTLQKEHSTTRALVLAAVALHNRFALKESLSSDIKMVTNVVRDSDKCDIMRIIAEEITTKDEKKAVVLLSVIDDDSLYTDVILEDALAGRVAAYSQLRSVNDFKILLGTWIYDLYFNTSKRILKDTGYLEAILIDMKADACVLKVRDKLLNDLSVLC